MKGLSMEDAIFMTDKTSMQAVPHEKVILAEMFGPQEVEWTMKKQALLQEEGKYYDRIDITLLKSG